MAEKTDFKLIANGHILEFYQYEKGVYSGFEGQGGRRAKDEEKSERTDEYRRQTTTNARNKVRRLVLANFDEHSKFITLTFKENKTDVKECNKLFKSFIEKLRYLTKKMEQKFKYVAVIEFQERGAVHYHMICNLPYIKWETLLEKWRKSTGDKGGLDIRDISKVDNVGAYMVKYMLKDIEDKRLQGQKAYLNSQGLQQSSVIRGNLAKKLLEEMYGLSEEDKRKAFANEYTSEHHGQVKYTEFNLKRDK